MMENDTIAAIATALGQGGVGIIRVSGPLSRQILKKIFRPASAAFTEFKPWMLHHGHVLNSNGQVLDEVLAVFMPAPRTFTGEDIAEVHCHGGAVILGAVLNEIFNCGARLATPGEFTKRAFLNGRIDLTQAEAVAESIAALSESALVAAQNKLEGGLALAIKKLGEGLLEIRANLALAVDFPEEELEIVPAQILKNSLTEAKDKIASLVDAHRRIRPYRTGTLVVIAGQVNVGKSSLLNSLVGRTRAIVSSTPGTTRDFLEEQIDIMGLPVRLIDTAGMRKTGDEIEKEGLALAKKKLDEADIILLVVDSSKGPSYYEEEMLADYGSGGNGGNGGNGKILGVSNKIDLPTQNPWPGGDFPASIQPLQRDINWVGVSAKFGTGQEELLRAIHQKIICSMGQGPAREESGDSAIAPNLRQVQVLTIALAEVEGIIVDLAAGVPYDLLGIRVELLCAILSEVTGEVSPEDVLDKIFAEFCLGK